MEFLAFSGIGLMGFALFFLIKVYLYNLAEGQAADRFNVDERLPIESGIYKLCKRGFDGWLIEITRNFEMKKKREDLEVKILRSGLKERINVDEALAWKFFCGIVIPVGLIVYNNLMQLEMSITTFIGLAAVMFHYPEIFLNGQIARRQTLVELQMPFVIDLLTLSVEAGLDFTGAIGKVVEKAPKGPLVEELAVMMKEISLGASRVQALRNLAYRVQLDALTSLVAILITAEQMGTSIGAVLRVQSELLRHERFMKAEKKGATASQAILFPLIFFILPAVFVMIFGPVILQFVYGGNSLDL